MKFNINLQFSGQEHLITQPEHLIDTENHNDDELPLIGEQLSLEDDEILGLSKKKKKKTKVIVKDHDKKLHKDKHHPTKHIKKVHKQVYIKKDSKKKGYTKIMHKSADGDEVGIVNENSDRKG